MTLAGFPIAPTLYFPLLYITSAFLLLSPPSLMLSALRYDLSFFVMAFIGFIRRSPIGLISLTSSLLDFLVIGTTNRIVF